MTGDETGTGRTSVDLDAVVSNFRALQHVARPAECAAVVKANAYGLGVTEVARVLERAGCITFFVATLAEAIELRGLLPSPKIFVLNGVTRQGLPDAVRYCLTPVINTLESLDAWRDTAKRIGGELPLCIQTDTGMSRFGLMPADVVLLSRDPARIGSLRPTLLMSHLSCADTPDHPANRAQLDRFKEHAAALNPVLGNVRLSLSASSGIFLGAPWHFDLVRPGAALFGISPNVDTEMRAVFALHAPCVQLRWIGAGDTVGYGATHIASHSMRLATIACGYADGFLRAGSNRGAVAWRDTLLPIVGLISMDSITVDATHPAADDLTVGDMVEIIGPRRALADVARDAGTIGYEMLTTPKRRARRIVVGHGASMKS